MNAVSPGRHPDPAGDRGSASPPRRRKGGNPLDRLLRRAARAWRPRPGSTSTGRRSCAAVVDRVGVDDFNAIWTSPRRCPARPRSRTRPAGSPASTPDRLMGPSSRRRGGAPGRPRRRSGPLSSTAAVLVACSGGADSLALAAATAFEADRMGLTAGLVTVDHGLQPGSDEQAARVAAIGYELGLDPVETRGRRGRRRDGGPEAAARDRPLRRAQRRRADALGAHVLLGHTLDDQAETVLLGPRPGLRAALDRRACGRLDGPLRAPVPRPAPSDDRGGLRGARLHAVGRPAQRRPERSSACGCGARCCRCSRTSCRAGSPRRWPAPRTLVRDDLDALDDLAEQRSAVRRDAHGLAVAELRRRSRGRSAPRVLRTLGAARAGAGPLTAEHTAALDALVTDWHGQGPVDLPGRSAGVPGRLGD